jgi:hypothetical protein
MELDSHADTVDLGSNCIVLHYNTRECNVSPYRDAYDAIPNVPIVTGATAWTFPQTGETFILVFNEALWMGSVLNHSLLNPNQLRYYGTTVQDNPYSVESIHIGAEDGDFILPLLASGTMIYFDSHTPSNQELHTCRHITLTSPSLWNPHDITFPSPSHQVEEISQLRSRRDDDDYVFVTLSPDEFAAQIIISVKINEIPVEHVSVEHVSVEPTHVVISDARIDNVLDDVPLRRTFVSDQRHTAVTAAELSERWCIGLAQATNTIKITTQHGVRSATLPLSRRYKADRIFGRPLLRGQFYTDTVDGRCKLMDGNSYAQVFATKDLFVAAYPMESKSLAGEGLRQFIHDYGRPEHLTFDGSKEQGGK